MLKNVDALLHIDIDVLVLSDIVEFWKQFEKFNHEQIAGMSAEDEAMENAWYPRYSTHRYYGQFGINAGIMMMNLTRMRNINFFEKMLPLYEKYKKEFHWGDQDILNVYFDEYPSNFHLHY